jgi:hypothetical protein
VSSYDTALLEQLLEKHKQAPMTVKKSAYYWQAQSTRVLHMGPVHVTLEVPSDDVPDDLASGIGVEVDSDTLYGEDVHRMAALLAVARKVATDFNAAKGSAIEQAKERLRKREEEQRLAREKREQVLAERKERLLTEFLEEKGRIRIAGMKRWRPVTVKAHDDGDGSYTPVFHYQYHKHGYREWFNGSIAAFEVKIGSRYRNVWSDGKEDLGEWDRGDIKESKPYDGMLPKEYT